MKIERKVSFNTKSREKGWSWFFLILVCGVFLGFGGKAEAATYDYPDISLEDDDRVAWKQDLDGAGPMDIIADQWNVDTGTEGRKITLTSESDNSPVSFLVVGTVGGSYQEETIDGPNNETVASENYFDKVERIIADGAITEVSAGIGVAKIELDAEDGNEQEVELMSDTSITLASLPEGESNALQVILLSPGDYDISFNDDINWEENEPSFAIGYDYVLSFWSNGNGGINASYTRQNSFDWYVDSVNGSDSNSGTSPDEAFATISKLMEQVISEGSKIGLARESHWFGQGITGLPNSSEVWAYGIGNKPILDCAMPVDLPSITKVDGYVNVYKITAYPDLNVTKTHNNFWEENNYLTRQDSIANVDVNPGTFYPTSETVAPVDIYFHVADSSDPRSNENTYYYAHTQFGLHLPSNGYGKNIVTQRNLNNNGSLVVSEDAIARGCEANYGSFHNVFVAPGASLYNVSAQEAYFDGNSSAAFVYNANDAKGKNVLYDGCKVVFGSITENYGTGFMGHINQSGFFGSVIYRNSRVENASNGFGSNDANKFSIINSSTHNVLRPLNFYQAVTVDGLRVRPGNRTVYQFNFYNEELNNLSHLDVITNSVNGGLFWLSNKQLSIKNSKFEINSSAVTKRLFYLGSETSLLSFLGNQVLGPWAQFLGSTDFPVNNLTSDYNGFELDSPDVILDGNTYSTISAYQDAIPQDQNSVIGDTTAPTVTDISFLTADGIYGSGDEIEIAVQFSETVNVDETDGTPSLWLETGATDREAAYTDGSGTDALTFSYAVEQGDETNDLEYTSTESLFANMALIRDAANNYADLTLATPGEDGSLSINSEIIIDSAPPAVLGDVSPIFSTDITEIELALITDENATCKYSTVPNTVYDDMENIFTTTGETSHTALILGLTSATSYTYYVRCQDEIGNQNQNDYEINFHILASSDSISVPTIQINQEKQSPNFSEKLYLDKKNFKLKGDVSELSGGTIKIYADNKKIEEVDIETDGSWSKKLKFKNESYNLKLKYYDSEGNEIDSQTYRLEVDNENPSFSNIAPIYSKTDRVSFPAQDQKTKIDYYKVKLLDDQGHILRKWKKQNQPNYFVPKEAQDQAHILIIRAYDKAGNYAEQEIMFQDTTDKVFPVIPATNPDVLGENTQAPEQLTSQEPEDQPKTVQSSDTETRSPEPQPDQPKQESIWWKPWTWF